MLSKWQKNIIAEYNALYKEIKSLSKFVKTDDFQRLTEQDKKLLNAKYDYMCRYYDALEERIINF